MLFLTHFLFDNKVKMSEQNEFVEENFEQEQLLKRQKHHGQGQGHRKELDLEQELELEQGKNETKEQKEGKTSSDNSIINICYSHNYLDSQLLIKDLKLKYMRKNPN